MSFSPCAVAQSKVPVILTLTISPGNATAPPFKIPFSGAWRPSGSSYIYLYSSPTVSISAGWNDTCLEGKRSAYGSEMLILMRLLLALLCVSFTSSSTGIARLLATSTFFVTEAGLLISIEYGGVRVDVELALPLDFNLA